MKESKEYARGQSAALKALTAGRPVSELEKEWKDCKWGDDYDRGYLSVLQETLHKPYTDDASLPIDTTREKPVSSSSGEGADSPPMRATEIAGRASDLVGGDRDRQHGQKHDNFLRIATMWNAWLQTRRDPAEPLSAHDVGIMMTLMKAARTQSGALNIDDYTDMCGYAACAGEIAQSHGM